MAYHIEMFTDKLGEKVESIAEILFLKVLQKVASLHVFEGLKNSQMFN